MNNFSSEEIGNLVKSMYRIGCKKFEIEFKEGTKELIAKYSIKIQQPLASIDFYIHIDDTTNNTTS